MRDGRMFRETLGKQLEGKAKSREDRAKGHEFGLGHSSIPSYGAGLAEEANHLRSVGKVDIGSIQSQYTPPAFPALLGSKGLLVPNDQSIPEIAPESDRQSSTRLAECFLADSENRQLWTQAANQSPRLKQTLGHGGGVKPHVHH
jgi:hypothetical protein